MIIKNLLILLFISVSLVSCGRRGPLQQLEPSGYPHYYPKPTVEVFEEKNIAHLESDVQSNLEGTSGINNNVKYDDSKPQLELPQDIGDDLKPGF